MTDKLQSDAVMWGILKAVGVLALVGLVVGMCVNMRMPDFSSGLSGGQVPVRVLVTNMTPDSVVFMWATKEGTLKGTGIVPPNASNVCARFDAKADTGTYRAFFEVRNPAKGHESVGTSGWFAVTGSEVWVDTVRVGKRQIVKRVNDLNLVAAHPCD